MASGETARGGGSAIGSRLVGGLGNEATFPREALGNGSIFSGVIHAAEDGKIFGEAAAGLGEATIFPEAAAGFEGKASDFEGEASGFEGEASILPAAVLFMCSSKCSQ